MSEVLVKPGLDNTLERKFWKRVDKRGIDDCWLWGGKIAPLGYGKLFVTGRKEVYAHRFSFMLCYGAIPDDLVVHHKCCVRACVNPNHLEVISNVDNVMRGNSPLAQHARKTHCPRGHEYTESNTYLEPLSNGNFGRHCKCCMRARTFSHAKQQEAI